jgi:hypothetical protein
VNAKHRRIAEYTDVPPGDYVFEVSAGRFGDFGEPKSLPVRIEPRLYETWIAKGLFWLTVVSVLALLYLLRMRQLKQRERQQEARIADLATMLQRELEDRSLRNRREP